MSRLLLTLFRSSRPTQLLVVTMVYALGIVIALAKGIPYDLTAVLWGFAALIPISTSIHYINEYADYETDGLTKQTPFSGGSGALHQAAVGLVIEVVDEIGEEYDVVGIASEVVAQHVAGLDGHAIPHALGLEQRPGVFHCLGQIEDGSPERLVPAADGDGVVAMRPSEVEHLGGTIRYRHPPW